MALLASELASVHAMRCIRCGETTVLERPAEPTSRVCGAPGATAACQFVRLCSADRLDDASAQQLRVQSSEFIRARVQANRLG